MDNRIVAENRLPGTLDWQITQFHYDYPASMQASPIIRGLRSSAIEGFASRTSVYPGETIDFKISVSPSNKFEMDIYRLGYYQGLGGRHMTSLGTFQGQTQPVPMESIERLRECEWGPARLCEFRMIG